MFMGSGRCLSWCPHATQDVTKGGPQSPGRGASTLTHAVALWDDVPGTEPAPLLFC